MNKVGTSQKTSVTLRNSSGLVSQRGYLGVNVKVLYESDRYLVSAGGEGAPIVTFQSYRPDQSIETYRHKPWGANFLEICGYSWVAVQPSFNDWYQSEEIAQIAKKTRKHLGNRRPILYGSSMGGYAAYKFSAMFKAIGWLAIVPQHEPNSDLVLETRWMEERKFLADNGYTTGPVPPPVGVGVTMFDPKEFRDKQHATVITNIIDNKHFELQGYGHSILEKLYLEGKLKDIILSQFDYISSEHEKRKPSLGERFLAPFLSNKK